MSGAAPDTTIRILLVGPQRLLLQALKARLEGDRFEIAGIAADSDEVGMKAEELMPHAVLLDATENELDVVDAMRRIGALKHPPKVVVLSDEDTELHSDQTVRAGTAAFVRKPADLDELPETLVLVITLMLNTPPAEPES
jgi:DNA-binding NarL/FixJ family response regulator